MVGPTAEAVLKRVRTTRAPLARLIRACGLACALVLTALPAHAFELVALRPVREGTDRLAVELRLDRPIEPRVARSLRRGMPATLTLHAELWRRRNGWFDRLEQTSDATFRLRYDVWGDRWRLDRPDGGALVVRTLDSLGLALADTLVMPVASLAGLGSDAPCYVVLTASLRPLHIEDAEEVEGWLSGEVRTGGSAGLGVLTGLPRSLFEAARNFAGFGDLRTRRISEEFTPARLPVLDR